MKRLILLMLLTAWVGAKPTLQPTAIHETGKGKPGYTIEVKYPGPNPAALQLVQAEIAAFKKDYTDVAGESGSGIPCELNIEYEILYSGPSLTTVLFSGWSNLGGAHPNSLFRQLLLSPQGKPMALTRCFREGQGWLTRLQTYCRQDLKKQKLDSEADWILRGTAASLENYQLVLPTARGLRVIFADYQVAPHAVGPQEVLVPYSVVAADIAPGGPLAFALR